jgi:hypothetical protein
MHVYTVYLFFGYHSYSKSNFAYRLVKFVSSGSVEERAYTGETRRESVCEQEAEPTMDLSFSSSLPAAPPPPGVVPDFETASGLGLHLRVEQVLQACIILASIVLVFRLVARIIVLKQFGLIDCEFNRARQRGDFRWHLVLFC